MCVGCVRDVVEREPGVGLHEDSGSVAAAIKVWYALDGNGVGGVLHVQLDDFNLEDDFMDPLDRTRSYWSDVPADRFDMADAILAGLKPMTEAQRNLTVGLAHGDIRPDGRAQHGWRYTHMKE